MVHEGRKWKGAMVRHACEFSYYCDGKSEHMKEPEAIVRAMEVAELAMSGGLVEDTLGATHYHSIYVIISIIIPTFLYLSSSSIYTMSSCPYPFPILHRIFKFF